MQNDMRDRLIGLISSAGYDYDDFIEESHERGLSVTEDFEEWCADHLIANGVIVPPCKVGDKFYRIVDMSHTACKSFVSEFAETVEPYAITYKDVMGHYSCIPFEQFGKTVFLTKDQAEQKLKELSENGNL